MTNQVSPTVEFYLSNVGFILSKAQENNDLVFWYLCGLFVDEYTYNGSLSDHELFNAILLEYNCFSYKNRLDQASSIEQLMRFI